MPAANLPLAHPPGAHRRNADARRLTDPERGLIEANLAAGRLPGAQPVAIIDIGSNSVRLVVYERHARAPTPIYNEKLLCGLGRGVATTGRLPADATARALTALARFRVLCASMRVSHVTVLATAAARDAENGKNFLQAAAEACGYPIELLTGEREAALSAQGIISGFHEPDGVVGDLGGGSLELMDVAGQATSSGVTLPLGGLTLKDLSGSSTKRAQRIARDALVRAAPLGTLEGRTFYAIGGTWRALARLQMIERDYPLRVMHGYDLAVPDGGFLGLVERLGLGNGAKAIEQVAEARRPLLAYGALVLDEIVRAGKPARLLISALGVREGHLYDTLGADEQRIDPLIEAASNLNILRSRSALHGEELRDWTDAVVLSFGDIETAEEKRLRHAACLLSDIGWRAHPDYRGEQSLAIIAHAAFQAIDHPGRAYLALAVLFRHEGLSLDKLSPRLATLASPRLLDRARLMGGLLRVAYPLSAAMDGTLPRTPLASDGGRLILRIPPELAALASERLTNRLRALAKLVDLDHAVEVG